MKRNFTNSSPQASKAANEVRIIGGRWRGSKLRFPSVPGLRPTPDRVRETLFNWLGQDLTGLTCVDLCSGTGALALEAASRGAARVVAVEANALAARAIESHAERLGAQSFSVHRVDAVSVLTNSRERFGVIFFDPPFDGDLYSRCEPLLAHCLAEGGALYVEAANELEKYAGLTRSKHLRAGAVHAHLFRLPHP